MDRLHPLSTSLGFVLGALGQRDRPLGCAQLSHFSCFPFLINSFNAVGWSIPPAPGDKYIQPVAVIGVALIEFILTAAVLMKHFRPDLRSVWGLLEPQP